MKRKDLERKLRELGAEFSRHGANHDIWVSRYGNSFSIPRHREIKETTANKIIKMAE